MSTGSLQTLRTLAQKLRLVILVACLQAASSLEIRRLSVPRWVQNGTEVILDCDYTYTENDIRLVVKWFFNEELEPVYQWIPQLNLRHVSGVLYGRLDMDYSPSPNDPYSQYRALRIPITTPELSGKYTCLIMSLAGQDLKKQEMTVYATAKEFLFDYTLPHEDLVNFTCEAKEVYPEPRMKIFYFSEGKKRRVFEGGTGTIVHKRNNSFDITHWTTPNSRELPDNRVTDVECFLEVFGSPFQTQTRITYVPGVQGFVRDYNKAGSVFSASTLLYAILQLILVAIRLMV